MYGVPRSRYNETTSTTTLTTTRTTFTTTAKLTITNEITALTWQGSYRCYPQWLCLLFQLRVEELHFYRVEV